MATFKICVKKNQQRSTDGKYPVSIRVTWQRQSAYIPTNIYVSEKQITKTFEIKDSNILRELSGRVAGYEDLKVKKIGARINQYTARELANFLVKHSTASGTEIDFVKFSEQTARDTSNKGTAGIYTTVVNSLVKFANVDVIPITDINASFLKRYADWLIEREFTASGVNLYMRTIRALFNKARDHYNDDDKGDIVITHYPFKRYKIPQIPETAKRAITSDQVKAIRDCAPETHRGKLARDVFMLSFYLIGINTVDLYNAPPATDGRIGYFRAKTSGRRTDKAYISIAVPPEASDIIERYTDPSGKRAFSFYQVYADYQAFNKNVNIGLKDVAKSIEFTGSLQFYAARHSWATIARNQCGISKDDIHEALNHASGHEMRVTDIYIRKDWGVIDSANRKVQDLIAL